MLPTIRRSPRALALAILSSLFVFAWAAPADAQITSIEFLGETDLATGQLFEWTEVGGLSAIVYNPETDLYYVLADDNGERAPARFYALDLSLVDGRLGPGAVRITDLTALLDTRGQPFTVGTIDPEGLALSRRDTLYLASEGNIDGGSAPSIREIELDGSTRQVFDLPPDFAPRGGQGPRHNKAFESLTISPNGNVLFAATENALFQDGPEARLEQGSPVRLIRFRLPRGRQAEQFLYWTEPLAAEPTVGGIGVAGLVELLALDDDRLLALERSYSAGHGFTVRLFLVELEGAERLAAGTRLDQLDLRRVRPARKQLLIDFSELGVRIDNLEGMTFGPTLPDGRRLLVLVSDNNFNPDQISQFLAFAVGDRSVEVHAVQGRDHRSPLEGAWVLGMEGIVTAVANDGFWIQSRQSDSDPATSEGVQVSPAEPGPLPSAGDLVLVSGRVVEAGRDGELPVTQIAARGIRVEDRGYGLPDPVRIGERRFLIPASTVDDDGLTLFQPEADAADFLESLEGMRIAIEDPAVVGPTNRFGEMVVVASEGRGSLPRTPRGGLLSLPSDANPERLILDNRFSTRAVEAQVGDVFQGPVTGVLDYGFGAYRLRVTEALPPRRPSRLRREATALASGPGELTVATYNVANLSLAEDAERIGAVARDLASNLGAPDVVALQEIQDDSGPEDDGTVTAAATLNALIRAIQAAGGPAYVAHQIDPRDNGEGGQPGANIRVALLLRPDRVRLVGEPAAADGAAGDEVAPATPEPDRTVQVAAASTGSILTPNPGRVAADHPCFVGDEARAYAPTRRPLAAELEFAGRRFVVIVAHLKSKRGDDPLFGTRQPPRRPTEGQRSCQAVLLADLARELADAAPDTPLIILGDLNDPSWSPALRPLAEAGLVNLSTLLPATERYSHIYRGAAQDLDHILISRSLARDGAPEVDIVHLNAEWPAADRVSDHDPVVAKIRLGAAP